MLSVGPTRRGEGPAVRWETVAAAPSAGLRDVVHGYGGFLEEADRPVRRTELPRPAVVLVVSIGTPPAVARGGAEPAGPAPGAFVAGVGHDPVGTAHSGRLQALEVAFSPLSALALFGVPAAELAGRVVDLSDLCGAAGTELVERLATTRGWRPGLEVLDAGLHRLRALSGRPVDPVAAAAWRYLAARRGRATVAELEDRTGWDRRRLATGFREHVGLTPKRAQRLVRFHHAAEMLRHPARPLAVVAAESGYCDQAHLDREFRALAGCTPTAVRVAHLGDVAGTGMAAQTSKTGAARGA